MNVACRPPFKSLISLLSHRAAISFLVLSLVVASGFSCTGPQDSTVLTLTKLRETWIQDLRTKNLEHILKFYAPDAAFLQPTGERITGSTALRTLFQSIMATFNSDLTLQSESLETSGDLAYDTGDFNETLTVVASGAKITSKGSYIIVFRRQRNGSWLIVQQVWTGTPPAGT